MLIYELLI